MTKPINDRILNKNPQKMFITDRVIRMLIAILVNSAKS